MAEQSGTARPRLQTSWHAAHQSYSSYTIALKRHRLGYVLGIGSRSQLEMAVHVEVQLKPAHLQRYSTDGRAVGHGAAATPDQLTHSASVVLVI